MKFSQEMLMAYADGELDAQTRQAIEAEMAADPLTPSNRHSDRNGARRMADPLILRRLYDTRRGNLPRSWEENDRTSRIYE